MFLENILVISEKIVKFASQKGFTLATAESCTGGLIASALTEISGSSSVFEAGFVTYSNAMKKSILGVKNETLEKFGAVSQQTVKEMAEGAKLKAGVTFAVSTSGIAGPTGGSAEKPVGLVHYAIATPSETLSFQKTFKGTREDVRLQAVEEVLHLILIHIAKY